MNSHGLAGKRKDPVKPNASKNSDRDIERQVTTRLLFGSFFNRKLRLCLPNLLAAGPCHARGQTAAARNIHRPPGTQEEGAALLVVVGKRLQATSDITAPIPAVSQPWWRSRARRGHRPPGSAPPRGRRVPRRNPPNDPGPGAAPPPAPPLPAHPCRRCRGERAAR